MGCQGERGDCRVGREEVRKGPGVGSGPEKDRRSDENMRTYLCPSVYWSCGYHALSHLIAYSMNILFYCERRVVSSRPLIGTTYGG